MAIARVASQNTGKNVTITAGSNTTLAFPGNITSGNLIVIVVEAFQAGILNITVAKSSGTATLGTITQDKTLQFDTSNQRVSIFSAPVTGTGSLTLVVALSNTTNVAYTFIGINEYSGNTIIVDGTNTVSKSSGSTLSEDTGNITLSASGLIVSVFGEDTSGFDITTRTDSDNDLYVVNSAAIITGAFQDKLASAGTYNITSVLTITGSSADQWGSAAVSYIETASGGSGAAITDNNFGSVFGMGIMQGAFRGL